MVNSKTSLVGLFSRLEASRIMVIGDFMLDTYTIGKVRRISPEAPVAVLQVERQESRPGGAGNVILNLLSLGCSVTAIGRIGRDLPGQTILHALAAENVDIEEMVVQDDFQTPVKNRLIADNQQIVRVDFETAQTLPKELEAQILEGVARKLPGIQVVAISDYAKGVFSRSLIAGIIKLARAHNIPVIVDPKDRDFSKYAGATLIKPNLSEAYAAVGLAPNASLDEAAAKILKDTGAEVLLITRSKEGISIFEKKGTRKDFPVRAREVKDVTGAGDTVLAMISCAIANRLTIAEASQLANVAAGIAVEHIGCARVSLSQLAQCLLETDVVNKVFDEEHLFALQRALEKTPFIVLALQESAHLTPAVFKCIRQAAATASANKIQRRLIVYVPDTNPSEEFIDLLASFPIVSFIVLKRASLDALCENMQPEAVCLIENDQLVFLDSVVLPL